MVSDAVMSWLLGSGRNRVVYNMWGLLIEVFIEFLVNFTKLYFEGNLSLYLTLSSLVKAKLKSTFGICLTRDCQLYKGRALERVN